MDAMVPNGIAAATAETTVSVARNSASFQRPVRNALRQRFADDFVGLAAFSAQNLVFSAREVCFEPWLGRRRLSSIRAASSTGRVRYRQNPVRAASGMGRVPAGAARIVQGFYCKDGASFRRSRFDWSCLKLSI